jgi:outer membrane protein insertion porin family
VPVHPSWLRFTRLRGRADKPFSLGPLSLHLKAKAGHIHGDLPPYEAFPIGGTNSVRGYSEGAVGSGRSWVESSAEARFPIVDTISGCCFFDYGTDLSSGATVIGNPAGTRNKPGSGYGYGGGVRMDTPLGPLRLEYAWNDARAGRFHIGVGYD